MEAKFNLKESSYDFIDFDSPALMGHIEKGILEKVQLYETDSIIGNIYRARVIKKVKALDCAFIDIGLPINAYLPKKFMRKNFNGEEIKTGDTIFVEVKKGPISNKGPVVSMDYSLKGEDLVLLPMSKGIKISQKIQEEKSINRLLAWSKKQNISHGMIFRTSSQDRSLESLSDELEQLGQIQDELDRERNFLPTPKLLISKSPLENFLLNRKDAPLIVNHKAVYKKLVQNSTSNVLFLPHFSLRDEVYFRKQFDRIFNQIIYLDNGSNLYIDRTEALTVIDINTAHGKSCREFEEFAYETNILAAKEITKQIILRNISGMIVIDFLRCEEEKKQASILELFYDNLSDDTLSHKIFGFTRMGLFEMSRERKKAWFEDDYAIAKDKARKEMMASL